VSAVGKSAFGEYLLWQAVRARRTAVYVSHKGIACTIFYADGRVAVVDKAAFADSLPVLRDPSTVLIYDGFGEGSGRPPHVAATIVQITTPLRSRFKSLAERGARVLIFPVYSRDEIGDLLEAAHPSLHTPEGRRGVWERYHKWGGIPRLVLTLISSCHQHWYWSLVNWVNAHDLSELLTVFGWEFANNDTASELFHLKPRGETAGGFSSAGVDAYQLHRAELASPAVKQLVYAAMQNEVAFAAILKRRTKALDRLTTTLRKDIPTVAKFM
jgi:hypothetical protein